MESCGHRIFFQMELPLQLGAIDGKHVVIRSARDDGALYFIYKGFHWFILFSLVDANYKFIWVDVGVRRSSSEAQIFNQLGLKSNLINGTLQVSAVSW